MGIRGIPKFAGSPADGLMEGLGADAVFIAGKLAGSEKGGFGRSLFDYDSVVQIEHNGSDTHSLQLPYAIFFLQGIR